MDVRPTKHIPHDDASAEHERALVSRIRAGDTAAFEALVRGQGPTLIAFARDYVESTDAAEDLVQEVFVEIWTHRAEWTIRHDLRGYLFVAVRNRALSVLRHRRVHRRWEERTAMVRDADAGASANRADDDVRSDELRSAIQRAVDALPERCRQVFLLSRDHHLSFAQIAEVMQISVNTVEVQMGRALRTLRQRLADWL